MNPIEASSTIDDSKESTIQELEKKIERLKEENFQLQQIINNFPGDVYWKDAEGVWLGLNLRSSESLRKMGFLFNSQDVIGKTDSEIFGEKTASYYKINDQKVMQSREEVSSEEKTLLSSGEELVKLSTKRPLYDIKGKVVGIIGNTVDITYLKNNEKLLIEAKQKAEVADKAKKEFLMNMRHDFRTPFCGIYSMVELLQQEETDIEKKEHLMWIAQSAKILLELHNEIFEFAESENGTLSILEQPFDLKQLIEDQKNIMLPSAKQKNLVFNLKKGNDIPQYVIGDKMRTQRILMNLLSNAIKFTQKGHVLVNVLVVEKDKFTILIKFIVADSGVGILADKQHLIYEKFTRLTSSYNGVYSGIGCGLSLVKRFVSELNGQIDMESQADKGTTFTVLIPFKLPLNLHS